MDARPFAGKTVLVTGAAARLGRTLALRLAALGADVVVHHNSSTVQAFQLCSELQAKGVHAYALRRDLSDPDNCGKLVAEAKKAAGKPMDFLVNNAAIYPKAKLGDLTWDDLQHAVAVNAWAPFELTRAFAAQSKRGAVVNLLDARIADYDWDHTGYYLAKQMLADLTRLCAVHYAPSVRVNGVSPGAVLAPAGEGDAFMDRMKKHTPLRSTPEPDDVADAVIYLLGAPAVTGTVIDVDGGRHLGKAVYG